MCPEIIEQSQPLINSISDVIKVRLRNGESLLDVERGLFKDLLYLGLIIINHAIKTLLAEQEFVSATHKEVRSLVGSMRSKGRVKVTIKTLFGPITVRTSYWVENLRGRRGAKRQKRRKTGSGLYPTLWMWGIYERCTPAVQGEVARAMALCSSCREGSDLLATRGIHIDAKAVCRLAYGVGTRAIKARDDRLNYPDLIPNEDRILVDRRVAVALDGGRYRARITHSAGRKNAKNRRGFDTPWKEPKGFIIYILDENGKPDRSVKPLCDFVTGDADVTSELLCKYLRAYGAEEAREIIFLADGAHWIWNRVTWLREELNFDDVKVTEVLDFYHAVEHLTELSKLPKGWSQHRRKLWVKRQRRALKGGDFTDVQVAIAKLGEDVPKSKQELFKREERYFNGDHKERLSYADFAKQRLPLGSGAIESAIRRVINQRIKSNGIFWKPENAELVMHMRAQFKTGRFEEMIRHATSIYPRIA